MQHDNLANLKPGETRLIGGKLYGRCMDCKKILRIGLFGGLHLCVP
jgi:hypothetical protein